MKTFLENDPKLSDSGLKAPGEITAAQGEGAACAPLADAVTEPDKLGAAASKLNAKAAVRCSAWLGAFVQICAEWDNRAKQNLMLGCEISKARALTYWSCAVEIRKILDGLQEASQQTSAPVQGSNSLRES